MCVNLQHFVTERDIERYGVIKKKQTAFTLVSCVFSTVLIRTTFSSAFLECEHARSSFSPRVQAAVTGFSYQLIGLEFLFHAACALCFLALSVVSFIDGIFRVVFWSCNSAVCLATNDSLQVNYSKR